jgi:hypothetical protein
MHRAAVIARDTASALGNDTKNVAVSIQFVAL